MLSSYIKKNNIKHNCNFCGKEYKLTCEKFYNKFIFSIKYHETLMMDTDPCYKKIIMDIFGNNEYYNYLKTEDPKVLNIIGIYHHLKNNFKVAKNFYEMAINKKYIASEYNLAIFYNHNGKNFKLYKTHMKNCINEGMAMAIYNLAVHYKFNTEKGYNYLKLAADHNIIEAIYELAYYNQFSLRDYDVAEKYYLLGHSMNYSPFAEFLSDMYLRLGRREVSAEFQKKNISCLENFFFKNEGYLLWEYCRKSYLKKIYQHYRNEKKYTNLINLIDLNIDYMSAREQYFEFNSTIQTLVNNNIILSKKIYNYYFLNIHKILITIDNEIDNVISVFKQDIANLYKKRKIHSDQSKYLTLSNKMFLNKYIYSDVDIIVSDKNIENIFI